jgi:hypothetical protein
MEYRKETNGWRVFTEHWWFSALVMVTLATSQIFSFFLNLSGTPWIRFLEAGAALLFSGAGLILYAKIPVYRRGRFFTFGIKSIPLNLKGCYRWGWRIFLFGVVLSSCLLLSKQ